MQKTRRRVQGSWDDKIFDVINTVLCVFVFIVVLYPLIFVVSASFSDPLAVLSGRVKFFPVDLTNDSYKKIFDYPQVILGYKNSLFLLFVGTTLNVLLTVLTAYPLSRSDFFGSGVIMMFFTFTMFISGGLIPTYMVVKQLGLYDSSLPVLAITMPGGDIYSLPYVQPIDLPTGPQKNWINKVWLDNLGLELPNTTEEIYQVLKAFKEQDANGNGDANDELPYSCRNRGVSIFRSTYGSFGIGNLGTTASDAYVDRGTDGKIRFFATSDDFKKQLEWIGKLYSEGLMDPEMFTQGTAEFTAKANQDQIGAYFTNDNNQQLGTHTNDFVTMRVPTGPDGHKQFNHMGPTVSSGRFAVSASNPYPEETIRWIDYYYGFEGATLIRLGREGLSYHVNADGTYRLDEDISNNQDGMTVSQAMGRYAIGFAGGGCPEFIFKDIEMARLPAESQEWMDLVMQDFDAKEVTPMIFLFTKEEQNEMNALSSDIRAHVDEMRIAFVTGKRSLGEWDQFVSEVEKMGLDRYVELHQASYDRYMAD